jgi:hypothetical protein
MLISNSVKRAQQKEENDLPSILFVCCGDDKI